MFYICSGDKENHQGEHCLWLGTVHPPCGTFCPIFMAPNLEKHPLCISNIFFRSFSSHPVASLNEVASSCQIVLFFCCILSSLYIGINLPKLSFLLPDNMKTFTPWSGLVWVQVNSQRLNLLCRAVHAHVSKMVHWLSSLYHTSVTTFSRGKYTRSLKECS